MRRLLLIVVLALMGAALAGPSTALAIQDCPDGQSTSWTNTAGGLWDDSNNWSNGVANGGCDAAITAPGTYTVTMGLGGSAKSLTVGGASGTQTLQIAGSTAMNGTQLNSLFTLGAGGMNIGTHGAVSFTSIGANPGDATSTGGGMIDNSGLLETQAGSVAGNRDIQNSVINEVTGVIAFHTDTNTCGCGNTHTWINHGTMITDASTFNTFTGTAAGVLFTQDGGTFTNNGRAIISGGYTHTGGTTTGNPIELCGSHFSGPSNAAAKFEFDTVPSVPCGDGEIDGDVGTGTSLLLHNDQAGALKATAAVDFTNNGTITFDGTVGAGQDQLIGGHELTNSSTGTINLSQPGSSQIQMKVTNHGNVHVTTGSTSVSGVSSNDATETVDSGTQLIYNNDFTLSGGTIANSGLFRVVGGTVTHTGGSSTGTAINVCGATLHAPGPGTASFEMDSLPGTCSGGGIDGDIGSGDSLRIHDDDTGDLAVSAPANFTNAGTLTLDGNGGGQNGRDIITHGPTITNTGTIQTSQPGISSQFQAALTNNGTVNVAAGAAFDTTGAVIQSGGTFNVGAGGTFGTNQPVTFSGGTIANSGTWEDSGGDLHHTGGSTTGNPVTMCGADLYPTGPGTASFQYDASCGGGGIRADIGSGDTVTFHAPGTTVTRDYFDANFTNNGTLNFDGGPGKSQHHSGTIVNNGTMSFTGSIDPGQSNNFSNPITNNGTFDIAAGTAVGAYQVIFAGGTADIAGSLGTSTDVSETGGATTVDGTLSTPGAFTLPGGALGGSGTIVATPGVSNTGGTVHPTGTLSITGTYTQGAGGAFAADVSSTPSKLAVSGNASIDGPLHVSTPTPQTGTFRILDSAALTGTFSSVDFTGQTDSVVYDATGVSLSGVAPPASTGAPALSGSATVGSTLSVTQGSWSGDPTSYAYQWRDCDASGGACTDIAGATSSTYVVAASDVGHTLRVVVTATNGGGSASAASDPSAVVPSPDDGGPPPPPPPPPDTTKPVLSSVSASPKKFRIDPSGKAETAVKAATPRGTSLKYSLSESARVVFTVDAATTGRKSGKKCVKATKKNRKKKHCTRYTRAGRFAVQSKAGANSHHFTGRIGSKKLKAGSYRITLVATDAAGNHSKARTVSIKVVAR